MDGNESAPKNETNETPEVEITISDSNGIHKFGSYEELMRWKEEQNENAG